MEQERKDMYDKQKLERKEERAKYREKVLIYYYRRLFISIDI